MMSSNPDHVATTGPLPPAAIIEDFLDPATYRALFDFALSQQESFRSAEVMVGGEHRVDPSRRINRHLRKVGPIERSLTARLLDALPAIQAQIGGRTIPDPQLELEVTAYGDGAFFTPHIDIPVGPDRRPLSAYEDKDRLISAIFYFHQKPRAFEGGDLRLYRFGIDPDRAGPDDVRDLAPADNRLIAFPSWALHEVRAVRSTSERFADCRFALNCWYCAA